MRHLPLLLGRLQKEPTPIGTGIAGSQNLPELGVHWGEELPFLQVAIAVLASPRQNVSLRKVPLSILLVAGSQNWMLLSSRLAKTSPGCRGMFPTLRTLIVCMPPCNSSMTTSMSSLPTLGLGI